ncbi:type II secretion system F family protein [Lutimaribacter sp. EGI FJ00015]|uniref:Type II secretion system F family protein n=1 Tax=Lutimaribacter degradans TaxID=2945989 RepID=A0ACC5ZR56_9RHOB|nr:type II secretion system F family protein [Lutimaribacter sp. EGI FJ00013]MCM2560610.1 type II secretion system F family protein [Lutimaribacter sp. EGI FJ00013]MCO0612447.1 type II secretion system F family protein [Lutimaribacter sp. EGI FJ00015]MCO0634434.1 type II secretion system F family protein [Lutimaribacter sp. EGI FJ00014]
MQQLNDILTGSLGEFGPLIVVGGLGLFLILATIPILLSQKKDPLEKLRMENERGVVHKPGKKLRTNQANNKLEKYKEFLEPQNEQEYSAVRQKLMQAGYRTKDSVRYFHFAQFALGIGGVVVGTIYYMTFKAGAPDLTTQSTLMHILGPGVVGYMAPKYWVTKRQQERQNQIQEGFPDALDMMLVCIEAGQSLDQSIIRVSKEIRPSFPALADEFEIVSYEIKAGKDKSSVLRDMGERCGVQDVSSFVTVLIQSASFGTSIADALRVYAGEMRDKRVMRAEEKANKLPTKMTLVTMTLTVPPLLIILVGPSVNGITNIQSATGN